MFAELEQWILSTLQVIFDQFGWLGVAGLMGFENATGITPSEIILGLAGWFLIAAHGQPVSMIFAGGLIAAVGSVLGASLTYWAARLGGRPLIDRGARFLRIPVTQIDRAAELFQRFGPGLVLFGRMLPGIRTLISIPAGLARMSFLQFWLSTFIGAYVWCTVLIGLGYLMGNEWEHVSGLIRQYGLYAAGLASLVGAAGALIYWRRMRQTAPALQPVAQEDWDERIN
ncbi:MAG: DedA family protein [Chloroflexota bacterium]